MMNECTPDPNDIRYVRNYVLKSMRNIASRPEEGREYARQILWSITEGQLVEGFPPILLERAKIALSLVRRGVWRTPWGYSETVTNDQQGAREAEAVQGAYKEAAPKANHPHARARLINNNYLNYNKNNNLDINSEESHRGKLRRDTPEAFANAVAAWRQKLGMPERRSSRTAALNV